MATVTLPQALELALQNHRAGRLGEAEAIYRQILAVEPRHAAALHYLGVIAHQTGRNDLAVEWMQQAVALRPDQPEYHSNLGEVYRTLGRLNEAIATFRRALELQPDYAEVLNNLGNALRDHGQCDEAAAAGARSVALKPENPEAQSNLGNALKEQGRLDEAMACYRRAVALKPGDALLHSNLVYTALFHPGYDARALREESAQWEFRHGAPLASSIVPHQNRPDAARRLKVGYLSPDFSRHVICHFLTPFLEAHNHAGFEIFAYAKVKRPDAITERLRKTVDVWRDVLGMRDEAVAELIRADGIDLLVDLTQHLADNSLPVLARKPAPIQVAWLGYPGSTGLRAIDYRFTDAWMEPEGAAWTETVETPVRLPGCWFCFDPIEEYPATGPLPAERNGHITFGCLNNFCKVNEAVLQLWAKVLRAVEGSRLLLRCPEGTSQTRVRQFFETRGIRAERVELVSLLATRAEFLDLFQRIDLALDPFPYNGGTTTCEALWMGIPVLTLPGSVIVSRIGLSILSAVGLPECAADSEADFIRLATSLAGDLPRLAQLRSTLRARMKASPFMDAPRFARHVEQAYREMWQTWCAGRAAE